MTNLSVVVITRNRLEQLKRCLDSLRTVLPVPELIVVDNGSDDGTVEYLHGEAEHLCKTAVIKAVFLKENNGVAKARNIGVKNSSRDFVMFLDDDAWLDRFDFLAVERYFNEHKDVALVAPKIFYPDGSLQESIRTFPTLSGLFWRGTGLFKLFPDVSWYKKYVIHDEQNIHGIDWSIGACQVIRSEAFEEVGGFDEGYFFGYEDADLCRRLKKAGWSCVYWPDAEIFHEYARTSARGLNMSLIRHLKSVLRFLSKGDKD